MKIILVIEIVCGFFVGSGLLQGATGTINQRNHKHCEIDIKDDTPKNNEPVYLTADKKLWYPDGPTLTWHQDETTYVSCTGKDNYFQNYGKSLLPIKCKQGRYFLVDGNPAEVKFKNLVCAKKVVADVVAKGKCSDELGNAGELSSIGFNVPQYEHLTYFTTCVNMQSKKVLWTQHKLHSFNAEEANPDKMDITYILNSRAASASWRSDFNNNRAAELSDLYSKDKQKKKFGWPEGAFLARGHMVPDADGTFKTWQDATYTYHNAVPQWQSTNNRNWKSVEYRMRKQSRLENRWVKIQTGSYGTLKNPATNSEPLTLGNGILPAPKWIFKKYYFEGDAKYLVVNIYNNPQATDLPNDHLCQGEPENLCASTSAAKKKDQPWYIFDNYNVNLSGRLVCCLKNA